MRFGFSLKTQPTLRDFYEPLILGKPSGLLTSHLIWGVLRRIWNGIAYVLQRRRYQVRHG